MIHTDSLKIEWIERVSKANRKADKILVEKMIRALYLLELLQKSGAKFLFKGGTALSLMTKTLGRLSIDIDIIMPEKPRDIFPFLDKVIENSDFLEYQENKRNTESKIDKAHFKFFYKPVANQNIDQEYILLDILFDASPYNEEIMTISIDSPFVQASGESISVSVPTVEAILGDKLTAFAPNTTGIPYGKDKEMEIIKQLYDITRLFEQVNKIEVISDVFQRTATAELQYRGLTNLTSEDVLTDILETSICIATRGKDGKGDFTQLQRGIRNIQNYIFAEAFHLEKVMIPAAKAAYLSALIQSGEKDVKKFSDPSEIADWQIEQPFNTRLNKLKKTNPEAFFYWYKTIELKRK